MAENIQAVGYQETGPFESSLLTNIPSITTTAQSTHSADGTVTISALYSMLAQVLGQTTALFQAQELTNRVLDELRQLIPESQRNAGLHRVEAFAETVADGQHMCPHHPTSPSHATDLPSVDEATRSRTGSRPLTVSTQETQRTRSIVHASVERGSEEEIPAISPLPHTVTTHASMGKGIVSTVLPEPQHGGDLTIPMTSDGNEERSMDAPDHQPLSTSQTRGLSELGDQDRAADGRLKEHDGQGSNDDLNILAKVLEAIQRSNVGHIEKIEALLDNWRVEDERQSEEIVDAIRVTANEQVPYNIQGYLDEFSKSLTTEVRLLLGEVGELHEERRHIQHEIGYLMTMQSTLESGGNRNNDRLPTSFSSDEFAPPPPPEDPPHPRPAWRTIPQRRTRRSRQQGAPPSPPPPWRPVSEWATWQPDTELALTPPSIEPSLLVPDRGSPGLFGPRSPRSSYHE